jgi:hypothetical protein
VALWIEKYWKPHLKGKLSHSFCGRGFYAFLFEDKMDRDLIFRSGPYFMGAHGMYLNRWTLDFNLENDIPSVVPVWVFLPFLPLHCWNDGTLRAIGNSLGKYIDHGEPKDSLQACACICVEVDMEKGLPEAINLSLDGWSYLQQVDYKQFPFKCKICHEYGHFAKRCPKAPVVQPEGEPNEKWKQPHRKKQTTKQEVQQEKATN